MSNHLPCGKWWRKMASDDCRVQVSSYKRKWRSCCCRETEATLALPTSRPPWWGCGTCCLWTAGVKLQPKQMGQGRGRVQNCQEHSKVWVMVQKGNVCHSPSSLQRSNRLEPETNKQTKATPPPKNRRGKRITRKKRLLNKCRRTQARGKAKNSCKGKEIGGWKEDKHKKTVCKKSQ